MSRIKHILGRAHELLCEVFLIPVKIYRRFFSCLKTQPSCRFRPTCSAYAMEAVREWGIVAGSFLAFIRIIRCNPFSVGGDDPVPKREEVVRCVRDWLGRK